MAGIGRHQLVRMQEAAAAMWGPACGWSPGEIAWAVSTKPDDHEVRFIGRGSAWRQPDYVVVLAATPEDAAEAIAWAGDAPVQVADGDAVLRAALDQKGYTELVDEPFEVDLRLSTVDAGPPAAPSGYTVRAARPGDDLVDVHRASWKPETLPYAAGHAPVTDPDATSSFTEERMARVAAAPGYRQDLHVVVEAAGG